mmetsp:Transcript_17221/g.53811  ORF Transcript_17221/g.53811 Transcript_17221/m.53811 type:complete len:288 (+) Transcript_17221:1423-2286(+)
MMVIFRVDDVGEKEIQQNNEPSSDVSMFWAVQYMSRVRRHVRRQDPPDPGVLENENPTKFPRAASHLDVDAVLANFDRNFSGINVREQSELHRGSRGRSVDHGVLDAGVHDTARTCLLKNLTAFYLFVEEVSESRAVLQNNVKHMSSQPCPVHEDRSLDVPAQIPDLLRRRFAIPHDRNQTLLSVGHSDGRDFLPPTAMRDEDAIVHPIERLIPIVLAPKEVGYPRYRRARRQLVSIGIKDGLHPWQAGPLLADTLHYLLEFALLLHGRAQMRNVRFDRLHLCRTSP